MLFNLSSVGMSVVSQVSGFIEHPDNFRRYNDGVADCSCDNLRQALALALGAGFQLRQSCDNMAGKGSFLQCLRHRASQVEVATLCCTLRNDLIN